MKQLLQKLSSFTKVYKVMQNLKKKNLGRKILLGKKVPAKHMKARQTWSSETVSILARWTEYFGDPTCAVIMLLILDEQYKVTIRNNGIYTLASPYSVRAISERTNIPISTVHRKLKHIFSFPVFLVDDGYFGFKQNETGGYIIRDLMPEVFESIDKIITKQNDA